MESGYAPFMELSIYSI